MRLGPVRYCAAFSGTRACNRPGRFTAYGDWACPKTGLTVVDLRFVTTTHDVPTPAVVAGNLNDGPGIFVYDHVTTLPGWTDTYLLRPGARRHLLALGPRGAALGLDCDSSGVR